MPFELFSQRLHLRDLKEEDVDVFFKYRSDAELCKYQNFMVTSRDEVIEFIKQQKSISINQSQNWKQIAICYNDELIGDCAFKLQDEETRMAELGITLRREFHGKSMAKEALQTLINYGFNNLNLHKIIAIVDCRNLASLALFKKLSFTEEACLRKHYWDKNDKDWFDEYMFGLLKTDLTQ